jgi:hypothetical protein
VLERGAVIEHEAWVSMSYTHLAVEESKTSAKVHQGLVEK